MSKQPKRRSPLRTALSVIGIVLCVILLPVLVVNVTLIVKSYINPELVPDFFGYKPFIVLSGSMEDTIMTGDLIVVQETDPETLQVGDIISYRSGDVVITHRIVEFTEEDGERRLITRGDANDTNDLSPVHLDDVEGILAFQVPGIGSFALFMQTPTGLIVFIALPVVLFLLADVLSRRREDKTGRRRASGQAADPDEEVDDLEDEVRRLYGELGAGKSVEQREHSDTTGNVKR